jgi:LuxR family transcriptional regulator, maltose regulon positive regulatory protein
MDQAGYRAGSGERSAYVIPLLATKLSIPPIRPNVITRSRLVERLNAGLYRKLTLISAPAGFGKTTLVSNWLAGCSCPVAWLSLDKEENDPARFLAYLIAAVQTIAPEIGTGVVGALFSPQPPPTEALLTLLLNDFAGMPHQFVLVLDDYHALESHAIDQALAYIIKHLPSQMHLVLLTREDPQLPLARWRAEGQVTELRAADLRFTLTEATDFLVQAMALTLSADDIAALQTRTEGWVVGLQLAALSLQGQEDVASFIHSFTGNHQFVLDYLMEEVLRQIPEYIQTFLLRTSFLERLCGPLCDAVVHVPTPSGQAILEYLERANFFLVPLDHERRWYRYHHLFADVLRQRLQQKIAMFPADEESDLAELYRRASQWFEENGLLSEAFHYAVAANDVDLAERLMEGNGMPLHFQGAVVPVLHWLASLPKTIMDARPSLWVMYASALSMSGQLTNVEPKLQAAEAALQDANPDTVTRNLIGHIAAIRAMMAATQYQVEIIIDQSRRALEYLHPDNLPVRTATTWKLGFAYQIQGERAAAYQAYTDVLSISQATGNVIFSVMATIGLGNIQELDNQLSLAAVTYQQALHLIGHLPLLVASEAHLGLARICYEWNDLDAAQHHGQQGIQLARQIENTDREASGEVLLARIKLARGDMVGASALLAQVNRSDPFVNCPPDVIAAHVLMLLYQNNLTVADQLVRSHNLPLSQARVYLALGDPAAAQAVLTEWRSHAEARGWQDERLKAMVLQSLAFQMQGEQDRAVQLLGDALALAEPGGFIRIFVDEGKPMAQLLFEANANGISLDYIGKLLAVFAAEQQRDTSESVALPTSSLIEPLSRRELEVLHLIAQGCSNQEIANQLSLALDTVKGHNRKIFGKLAVQSRTEAIARAHKLGLL